MHEVHPRKRHKKVMSQLKTAKDLVNHLEKPLIRFNGQHMERSNQRNMPGALHLLNATLVNWATDKRHATKDIAKKCRRRRSKTRSQKVEAAIAGLPKNEFAMCSSDVNNAMK